MKNLRITEKNKMPKNNAILSNESINSAFINNDLKKIYTILLKFFKILENDSIHLNLIDPINLIIKLLNSQKFTLIFKDQEIIIEEKLKDIYKKIDLIRDKNNSEFFFKVKIYELFERNLLKIFKSFNFNVVSDDLTQFLTHLIKNIPTNPEILFDQCLNLIENGTIKLQPIELLLDGIFETYPSIALKLFLKRISKIKKNETVSTEINLFLNVILNYSEIYSANYKQYFKKIKHLVFSKYFNNEQKSLAIQIMHNVIKEQPNTYFEYIFHIFNAFEKAIKLNQLNKDLHLLYNSLKVLYSIQSEKFLQVFEKNQTTLSQYLINLMVMKYDILSDFILEMILDFLKYYKNIHAKGKINEELLKFYLNFLKFLENNNLENEYFLFSIINHLNLKTFNLDDIGEDLTKNDKKIKIYYQLVIKEIEKSIKIIYH